jgi:hypothetical protein
MKYVGYWLGGPYGAIPMPWGTQVTDTNSWGADAQSCLTPPQANAVLFNQEPIVPNKGQALATTKNPDGSTRTANGTVAGTSITVNLPG